MVRVSRLRRQITPPPTNTAPLSNNQHTTRRKEDATVGRSRQYEFYKCFSIECQMSSSAHHQPHRTKAASCPVFSVSIAQPGSNLQAISHSDTYTTYQHPHTHNKPAKMVTQPAKMPPMNPVVARFVPVVMTVGIGKSSAKSQLDVAICIQSTNITCFQSLPSR